MYNCTKGFHCDISIHAYNVPSSNPLPLLLSHLLSLSLNNFNRSHYSIFLYLDEVLWSYSYPPNPHFSLTLLPAGSYSPLQKKHHSPPVIYLVFLFFGETGLWTLGFCTCKAGTLPLEPPSSPFLLWLFWWWVLVKNLLRLASNHDPPECTFLST
jgi:hypothetical protein